MRNVVQRLYQLFSHEDRLLILIDPDPDAIASALALKRLLWHRLTSCVIAAIRPITRPQNQRMVQLLSIALYAPPGAQARGLQPQGPGGQPTVAP